MGKINSRAKGHSFERQIAKLFRDMGFPCTTSRLSSKERDDSGFDLCGTGMFNVQLKAVERLGSYHEILSSMKEEKGKHKIVIHKRNNKGSVVVMELGAAMELLEMMIQNGVVKTDG